MTIDDLGKSTFLVDQTTDSDSAVFQEKRKGSHGCPAMDMVSGLLLSFIHGGLQFCTGRKLGHLLGRNLDRFPGLGISASPGTPCPD